jgi:hypothetical protein
MNNFPFETFEHNVHQIERNNVLDPHRYRYSQNHNRKSSQTLEGDSLLLLCHELANAPPWPLLIKASRTTL